jgi:hypothetical protein
MSENLDLVRSIYADWERGDFSQVEWADLEIEYTGVDGLLPGTSRGIQAMGAGWRGVELTSSQTNGRGGFRTCDLSRVKRALSH